ncbi:MAG: Maf family protein [Acidobacteriia bacterium]|nr:Maf family protein [Terriglobia bacterium]
MKLILASSSPRRAEIIRNAGFSFQILSSPVDETPLPAESPQEHVRRLAESKATLAARRSSPPAIVIAADTIVALDGRILGKPRNLDDARAMLELLSGRTHAVHTGLALIRLPEGELRAAVETTMVTFARLSPQDIAGYLASGEPFDKAGAYAIQGRGGRFIPRIAGCYFNVVGLPLARLCELLRELGWGEEEPR